MPFIKLAPAETPREALERINMEANAIQNELDARSHILAELLKLGSETADFEAGLAKAREDTYFVLSDQLRQARLACADEYCMLVELEIATMEERQKKRETP